MTGEYLRIGLPEVMTGALACLLVAAAITDLRSRIISNRLNLAIALLAPLYWWACGLAAWPDMALQLALGAGVLVVFTLLFSIGMMGGGDVKMLAALALWFPWEVLATLLVLMALLGGAVTLVVLVEHKLRRRPGQPEVPYGVAISMAALWVVGERYLNQFT